MKVLEIQVVVRGVAERRFSASVPETRFRADGITVPEVLRRLARSIEEEGAHQVAKVLEAEQRAARESNG